MENNSLMTIQEQYKNCNLLLPAASEAQLSPFYKMTIMEVKVDLGDNSGDVFKVGSIKEGNNWVETFSPAKPLLMKLAAAAGIQFDPNNTYGTRVGENCYKAKAYGGIKLPDGTSKTHCDEKVIDLNDEEANFRLEFMDKSIEGITDEKAAKSAAKMFDGEWIDSVNKYDKPCKAYKIADKDRQAYIDRSVFVNMTLLRKTAAEKAMTGAILRVVRALTGMKGQYTKAELSKPFAVSRIAFSPDYNNPEVRRAMLEQGMNSVSNMFGSQPMIGLPSQESEIIPADIFEIDTNELENPTFASDIDGNATMFTDSVNDEVPQAPPPPVNPDLAFSGEDYGPHEEDEAACSDCGKDISEKVADYSLKHMGRPLCYKCQKAG